MSNDLEKDLNEKTKPQKVGNVTIRVWDDGIVDARYIEIDKSGRGPAIKVPLTQKVFLSKMERIVHGLLDGLTLPEFNNYADDASSEKPIMVGTAQIDVYSDNRIVSIFTEIDRSNDRGAPRKNSTLSETEWKKIMAKYVGSACSELKLTISFGHLVQNDDNSSFDGTVSYSDVQSGELESV